MAKRPLGEILSSPTAYPFGIPPADFTAGVPGDGSCAPRAETKNQKTNRPGKTFIDIQHRRVRCSPLLLTLSLLTRHLSLFFRSSAGAPSRPDAGKAPCYLRPTVIAPSPMVCPAASSRYWPGGSNTAQLRPGKRWTHFFTNWPG